jgi:hypothetical protein
MPKLYSVRFDIGEMLAEYKVTLAALTRFQAGVQSARPGFSLPEGTQPYSERMNPADPPSRKKPAMIGLPPSARGGRPADIAAHASQVAQEWEDVGENYVRKRARELGIPEHMIGQPDYDRDGTRRAFDPLGQQGGGNTTGVIVDSGVLNPELLKGKKGGRIYPRMTVKERIDSTLAHEYEELRAGGKHVEALRSAAKTKLSIMPESRRLCKAMAR